MEFLLEDTLMLLAGALALSFLGSRIRPKGFREGFKMDRGMGSLIYRVGRSIMAFFLIVALLAAYGGTMGPLELGRVTIKPFQQTWLRIKKPGDPTAYAKQNLVIVARPAAGWRGASKTNIEYKVLNQGDRKMKYIVLRLDAARGSRQAFYDAKIMGPFYPGDEATSFGKMPTWVRREYFSGAANRRVERIVGGAF